jgi:formylglycine-generating enzyme required for sulfatase activity/tetratricopeptide (TPR) repeat protein
MNSDAQNQEVLKRILRAIELATKYHDFALYFVQCQLLTDQDNHINYLKEQCNEKGVELLKVNLSRKIIENPREEILKELNETFPNGNPDKLAIAVTGLEASILTDDNYESPAVLQILNMGREHYARDMPYPSLFWLPDYAITKIALGAPDFWAWRSGDVDELVSGEKAKRQAINEAIQSHEPSKLDAGIYQIIMFERLIDGHPGSENGTNEQKSEYRKLQYRLGGAYNFLEKYPRAHQHYRRALEIGKLSSDFAQQGKELNAIGRVCLAMGKMQKSLNYSHLFSIAVSTDTGLIEDLNKRIISEKLKNIFKINRYSLFDNATVTKEKEDEWVITDEEMFIVRKKGEELNIYKNFLSDSLKYFEKYFDLSVSQKDKKGQGVALGNIGLVYREMQQDEIAITYLKRALAINKKFGFSRGESDNLGNLGLAYQDMDNIKKAIECHSEALIVSKEIKDWKREIKDLTNIGVAHDSQGEGKEAIHYFLHALDRSQGRDPKSERDLLIKITHCFWKLEEFDVAQDYYKRAEKTCQELVDNQNLCDLLIDRAELSRENKKKIGFYEKALDLSRKLRDDEKELACLGKLIPLHYSEWDLDKAKNYINDARKLLGSNLRVKRINVWLRDGSNRDLESLVMNQEYVLCLNIGELDSRYSLICQKDLIFNLVSVGEVSNKPIKPFVKPTATWEEEQKQIPQPTPEPYDIEEKTIAVTESPGPETILHIDETQPTGLTPDQQLSQEPSELFHEEFTKEMVEVSVRLQESGGLKFDKDEGGLYVSWETDSETIYFGITPRRIGKQRITVEGAANGIPFDDLTIDVEVEEADLDDEMIGKFTLIPAGKFMMGSKGYGVEEPVHKVRIRKPFYLGTYPVTQREWKAVTNKNPSYFKGDDLPVEHVSWDDVQEFIMKLMEKEDTYKYRLPSEAEWEYACRAGTTTRYSFGSESNIGGYAWYGENSGGKTHPVGQKKSNSWGLYDMQGNVWEWVQDSWHNNYKITPRDGSAWGGVGALRVARGGCWSAFARDCRSARRGYFGQSIRYSLLGFRLLRAL